jgi:hypothetical protein
MPNFPEKIASALMESIMAAFRTEAADRRIVGMELLGRHDVLRNSLDQRRHQRRRLADPIGQRCAIELDPLSGIDAGLPIERKMIAVFSDHDMRQKSSLQSGQGRSRELRSRPRPPCASCRRMMDRCSSAQGVPWGVDQFEPPLDPLRRPSVRVLVHSGTIRLDSASSNRNSRRLGRPNSWDIASRWNFLNFEGGVP